jgi:hypothetical protein
VLRVRHGILPFVAAATVAVLGCSTGREPAPNVASAGSPTQEALVARPSAAGAPSAAVDIDRSSSSAVTPGVSPAHAAGWRRLLTTQHQRLARTVFATDDHIWLCRDDLCSGWSWPAPGFEADPAPAATLTLPCVPDLTGVAARGSYLAFVCDRWARAGRVTRLRISDATSKRFELPLVARKLATELVVGVAVDDAGDITATTTDDRIFRISTTGAVKVWKVRVPERAVLWPAVGPWLAYSDGAYSEEVAWRASVPSTPLHLGGGAFFNGSRMWVSHMQNGYFRWEGEAFVPTEGRFGGGLAGHGILSGIGPWQDDKLWVSYETAVLLLDEELREQRRLALPAGTKPELSPTFGMNPAGTRCFAYHATGELDVGSSP